MAQLTPSLLKSSGTLLSTAAAAGGGDSFANTGYEFLYINNGGGSPINVTFTVQSTKYLQETVSNRVASVTNGTAQLIGPFPPGLFNDSNGLVQITYSAVTSVTVAVFKLVATLS